MSEHAHGGELLVALMRAAGVDTAFGVVSVHNLPLVEAVDRELRFVPVRHEAASVNAADGYARARGGLGVAITSTGTGAGNAAGSLVEALAAASPVLHVTGQVESEFLDPPRGVRGVIHETRDQLGMLRAVSRHAATVRSAGAGPEGASAVLTEAVRAALGAPGGPVSVEWPIDLQYAAQVGAVAPPEPAVPPAPDQAAITEAARLLAAARRPLIWAGGGAAHGATRDAADHAGDAVRRLAERLGAGILTSNAGRGAVAEDHQLVIGNFGTAPDAVELLADADLLLAIGTHFRSNETRDYRLTLPANLIQIDLNPDAIGRVYPALVGVVSDAAAALEAMLTALDGHPVRTATSWRRRVLATRDRVRARLGAAIGPYLPICRAIRDQLPREGVIARDVTIPSSWWGNRLLDIYHPRTNLFPLGGGIGQGLAMGIGAATGCPDQPTVVIAGDGGLAVHLGELATLAQQQPWLVLLVFNDGGYGVLRNMQDVHRPRRAGVDLTVGDHARLAGAFDLPYHLVSRPERFAEAFAKALANRGPSMIEIDVSALGPMPEPFVPPVRVPERAR